eukprot:532414_1
MIHLKSMHMIYPQSIKSSMPAYLVYSVGGKANKFEIQYVFHDEHCLHLRKYKEAIRNYVFNEELQRAKPYKKKLIPNVYDKYRVLEMFGEKDLVLSMEHGVELERPSKRKLNLRRQRKLAQHHLYRSVLCEYKSIQLQIHSNNSDLMMNECIVSIDNHRMDRAFEDAMDYRILKYIDYELYGFCLWTFIISELEMKDRFSLWIILRLIISKLSTSSTIKLFHKTRTSLVRFDRIHLKHLCLTAIEKSTFPAQTALYLSGEFSAELSELIPLFTSIAHNLLSKIESDHLLTVMIEIPSDIDLLNNLSIVSMAIKYELVHFLDFARFKPIFETMWREFELLDPSKRFHKTSASFYEYWQLLYFRPSCFYYSPLGLFIISVLFYMIYLVIFTLHLTSFGYIWHPVSVTECVLWLFNLGYIFYEITEIIFKKCAYLKDIWNYWDLLLSAAWISIALLRFVIAPLVLQNEYIVYDEDGIIDERATRDTTVCQIYIALYCFECIVIWTRFIWTLQRTSSLGPLIQMILAMVDDTARFVALLSIIMIGFLFAVLYAIGGDICTENGADQDLSHVLSVALFIFQSLLGQQEWQLITSNEDTIGSGRSRILEGLIILFSIFGGILLLNLLIALMASTYERVRELGTKKVNFNRIAHTHSVIKQNALMPPPFNILVAAVTVLWLLLDLMIPCVTCGCYTLTMLTGIKYSLRQNLSNMQSIQQHQHNLHCKSNKLLDISYESIQKHKANKHMCCVRSIKSSTKRRTFCRYCRQDMQHEIGSIQTYFDLFRHYRILDEDDKRLMKHLLKHKLLCPICFRPYSGDDDRYYKWQVMLEIISYYIFCVALWFPLLIVLSVPSLFSWCNKKVLNEGEVIYWNHKVEAICNDLTSIFDREQQQNQKETRDVIQNTMSCDTPQRTPAFMTQTDGVESLFKLKRRYSQRKNEKHTQEEANGNSNDNEDTDTDVSVVADAILKNG